MSAFDQSKGVRTWSAINISDGQNQDIIENIRTVLATAAFEHVLIEADAIYHRTVISLVGPLMTILEAIDRWSPAVLQAVDLNHHQGSHYRMGAIDVIPFVLENAKEKDRQTILRWAKTFAKKVPVYLYGELNPRFQTVGSIRKGGLESLFKRIDKGFPLPDLGGKITRQSGVSAIGVRKPLGAFNIRLRKDPKLSFIVRQMRASNPSYPGLMSALFPVSDDIVDISFNLTDLDALSLKKVYDDCLQATGQVPIETHLIGLISSHHLYQGFTDQTLGEIERYFRLSHSLKEKVINWSLS